jgi:hypothetical protein
MKDQAEKRPRDVDLKLKEIREWLERGEHSDGSKPDCWADEMLQFCVETIGNLQDENSSLWLMLDEIKRSEIENFSEEFRKMMDRKLVELKLLALQKPGLA